MSFISDRPTRAKGLSISIQEVNDIKSLPRLPIERSTSSSKESRGCLQTFYRYECDTWAWEIFNIILSLAALATVIVALRHYDGKAAPEWPYSLTLNAFVSVCMMVMGATLTVPVSNGLGQLKWLMARRGKISVVDLDTLDRASRGMWGSVCTIFTWSGGVLGSFGSIVTIVAFAASPFAQQAIISDDGSLELNNDTASLVISCGPTSDLRTICTGTSVSGAATRGLNIVPTLLRGGFYSAIYGTYNSSIATNQLATCSTGNCTWAPFTTLSLSHSCMDVTGFLESNLSVTDSGRVFTLPGGPILDTSFDTFQVGDTLPSSRIKTTNVTAYTFAVLELNQQDEVKALECKIDFCVQVLQAELSNGAYKEMVLQQSTEHRQYQRLDPSRITRPEYLEFAQIVGSNATLAGSISLERGQPGCLGGLLNFDPREVVALTELGLEGIPDMVANVTISASRSIRTVCENGTSVAGTSWREVTLVRIDWWWLLLPVAVELLGIVFFVSVGVCTSTSESEIWKSSLMAALFHSLDVETFRGQEQLEGLYGMEQIAEKTSVTLSTGTAVCRSRLVADS